MCPKESDKQNTSFQLLPGTTELIANLRATINAATPLTTSSLLARASDYLGSPIGSGNYDFRYLYDALEVALHQLIEERVLTLRSLDPAIALEHLEKLMALLPTQRIRTT